MDILTFLTKYNLNTISFAYNHSIGLQHLVDEYDRDHSAKEYDIHNEYYVKILNECKKFFDIKIGDKEEKKIHNDFIKLKNKIPVPNKKETKEIHTPFNKYIENFGKSTVQFDTKYTNKRNFFNNIYYAYNKNKEEIKNFGDISHTHLLYVCTVKNFIMEKVNKIPN
jgi:hypothetical protein